MKSVNAMPIRCDEMQTQAVSCYGNDRPAMRGFERMAWQGATFLQAHMQIPKCNAMRGLMLLGRYTYVGGLRSRGRADTPTVSYRHSNYVTGTLPEGTR